MHRPIMKFHENLAVLCFFSVSLLDRCIHKFTESDEESGKLTLSAGVMTVLFINVALFG